MFLNEAVFGAVVKLLKEYFMVSCLMIFTYIKCAPGTCWCAIGHLWLQSWQYVCNPEVIKLDRCLRHRGGEPDQAPEFHAGAYFV